MSSPTSTQKGKKRARHSEPEEEMPLKKEDVQSLQDVVSFMEQMQKRMEDRIQQSMAKMENKITSLVESVEALRFQDYARALWNLFIPVQANPVSRCILKTAATANVFKNYSATLLNYKAACANHPAIAQEISLRPEAIEFNGLGFARSTELPTHPAVASPPVAAPATTPSSTSSSDLSKLQLGSATFAAQGFSKSQPANCIVLLETSTVPVEFDRTLKVLDEHAPKTSLFLCKKLFQLERQVAFMKSYYGEFPIVAALALRHATGDRAAHAAAVDAAIQKFPKIFPLLTGLRGATLNGVPRFQVI